MLREIVNSTTAEIALIVDRNHKFPWEYNDINSVKQSKGD